MKSKVKSHKHKKQIEDDLVHATKLTPEGESDHHQQKHEHDNSKYDCCCYVIYCPKHHSVAVSKPDGHSVSWLPFTRLSNNIAWSDSASLGALTVLSNSRSSKKYKMLRENPPFDQGQCMQVFRFQLPENLKFIIRLIYYFQLNDSNPKFKCCQNDHRIKWYNIEKIVNSEIDDLWGPELIEMANQAAQIPIVQRVKEFSLEEALLFVPRDPPTSLEESILRSALITEKDVERLYADFIDHCFPSFYQALESFKCYMEKYGFEKRDHRLGMLFHAFNIYENGYLTFYELLLGLATIEPNTVHAEWRVKFIFRYYDTNCLGYLTENELKQIIIDINPSMTSKDLQKKLDESKLIMGGKRNDIGHGKWIVTMEEFTKAIGSHKFRGTSQLCRSSKPIFARISRTIAARAIIQTHSTTKIGPIIKKFQGHCISCKTRHYTLATHSVQVLPEGTIEDARLLKSDHKKTKSSTKSSSLSSKSKLNLIEETKQKEKEKEKEAKEKEAKNNKDTTEKEQPKEQKEQIEKSTKSMKSSSEKVQFNYSKDYVFNENSAANYMLNLIRKFNQSKGTNRQPNGLLQTNPQVLWPLLLALYNDIEFLLNIEPRCPKISTPCYIFGDIHGNLEDLLSFERSIWKRMPCLGANFLFLGDYVDRGRWGLECALYLISFKIICPNKVTLLRGNHEVRELQAHYTYKQECQNKYGHVDGLKIWELTNKIFDKLPVSAIVDDTLYCAHGGIPKNAKTIKDINNIEKNLPNPQKQSNAAWEILWSDPCHNQQFVEMCNFMNIDYKETLGFMKNPKRGTAFQFNEFALNTFLRQNGLTHTIRAHEVPKEGFMFHFGPKCITIFSCSHYCGNNNESACILADDQTLRVIHLDTANNAPAT